MVRPEFPSRYVALLAVTVACDTTPVQPPVQGVFVGTDAREYVVSSPPHAAFATLENRTNGAVTVRRCLAANSPLDPVGVDVVVDKQQLDGTWQAVDLGFDCISAGAPRADAVLAPYEAALVLRLIAITPGRYRIRVAYGVGVDAAPTDTATSAPFSYR
jgi:hypothetical protein